MSEKIILTPEDLDGVVGGLELDYASLASLKNVSSLDELVNLLDEQQLNVAREFFEQKYADIFQEKYADIFKEKYASLGKRP